MFCTNCGEKIDETKRFCPHCGQPIGDAPVPPKSEPAPAPDAPVPPKPTPDPAPKTAPAPAQTRKPHYGLMALDAAIAFCALCMPIVTASFLSFSLTLPDLARGSSKLASLSSLVGSSSSDVAIFKDVSTFAMIMILAVVVSAAVDAYQDYKGGGVSYSGFVGVGVAAICFFFFGAESKEIASSLSGFGVSSVSKSVFSCGLGVWATGIVSIVSVVMHARRYC